MVLGLECLQIQSLIIDITINFQNGAMKWDLGHALI